eukprot:g33152.t1
MPIYINRADVEKVESAKFLGVTITDNLSTIESILFGCLTAWYGNCSAQESKKLQRVVCTAQTITEANLPSIHELHLDGLLPRKTANIINDPSHPSNALLNLFCQEEDTEAWTYAPAANTLRNITGMPLSEFFLQPKICMSLLTMICLYCSLTKFITVL